MSNFVKIVLAGIGILLTLPILTYLALIILAAGLAGLFVIVLAIVTVLPPVIYLVVIGWIILSAFD